MNLQGIYKYLCISMCTLCDCLFIHVYTCTCDAIVAIYPKVLYTWKSKKKLNTHSISVLDIKSSKYTCNSYFLLLIIEFTHDSIQWRTRTSFDISLGREKTQIRAAVCTSPVESTNFEIRDTPSAVKPTIKYPGETSRRFWPGSAFIYNKSSATLACCTRWSTQGGNLKEERLAKWEV